MTMQTPTQLSNDLDYIASSSKGFDYDALNVCYLIKMC